MLQILLIVADVALRKKNVYKWDKILQEVLSGRPRMSTTDENVEKVNQIVLEDRISFRVADDVAISFDSLQATCVSEVCSKTV